MLGDNSLEKCRNVEQYTKNPLRKLPRQGNSRKIDFPD